ncbi:ATP-binding cassette domain-containing protein [Paenibacillus sp. strain BS8-2]
MESEIIVRINQLSVAPLASNGRGRDPILKAVDLSITRGEWITLVGSNGSGKSTLAKAIAGMPLDGLSGRIERHAGSLSSFPIVMQHPDAAIVGATPWEDVVLMLEQWGTVEANQIPVAAERALQALRLGERQHQPIETLSGGQKQLTAIAGCLAASPELLILDEVTAMLDPEMSQYVQQQVRRLNAAGMTVIWITQRLVEIEDHDRILIISDGTLTYEGEGIDRLRRSLPGNNDSPAERFGLDQPSRMSAKSWSLQDVTVMTEDRSTVLLHHLNAEFHTGEITLIIGSNGAGKSTLLETIAGLRKLASGHIRLGEYPLWLPKRRRILNLDVLLHLGIAMQQSESQWFAANAREELLYSMKPFQIKDGVEQERRIKSALDTIGLPLSILGQDPWTLSGGQQRRLSLACLLTCEPDWLLLDEPTAGLDASGRAALCSMLTSHRDSGRGAIIVTHDLDTLLPIANKVMIVENGCLRDAAPEELPLIESPGETAIRLAEQAKRGFGINDRMVDYQKASKRIESQAAAHCNRRDASPQKVWQQPHTFDPRVVVASYLILSAVLLLQDSLNQLAAAAVVVIAIVMPFWPLFRQWIPVIRGYAILSVILITIGGLSFQPFALDGGRMETTAVRLVQLMLIMVLGMPILGLMTPLRLQRALDQTFGWLAKLSVPVHAFTLLVTLIFRFIPLLMREWSRFSKLARARGKVTTTSGGVPVKKLLPLLIPYLRAMLRLAEEMASALEARGIGRSESVPVYGFKLKPGAADAWLIIGALLGCGLLYIVQLLF